MNKFNLSKPTLSFFLSFQQVSRNSIIVLLFAKKKDSEEFLKIVYKIKCKVFILGMVERMRNGDIVISFGYCASEFHLSSFG